MQIPSTKHFSKQSIADFSDNEVLVSVPLLLMLLLHQEEEEQTEGRAKAGLMCAATSKIHFRIGRGLRLKVCPKSCKIVLSEL
jgi:hypothetical protein